MSVSSLIFLFHFLLERFECSEGRLSCLLFSFRSPLYVTPAKPHPPLQTIYNLGGRNFVVASPIDFGCIPFAINGNKGFCTIWEETISAALGEAYRSLLASLQSKLSGATFLYFDLYNLTRTNSSNAQPLGELASLLDRLSNVGPQDRHRPECPKHYL